MYLYIGTFVFALANGTLEAVANPLVATLFPKNRTHYLNILHAAWPAGLVGGGLIGWTLGENGVDWKIQLGLFLIPTVLYGFAFVGGLVKVWGRDYTPTLDHYAKANMAGRFKMAHVGKVIRANWKLMQEAFLEAYHSIATHPQLLLQGGDLAETRYDVFGNWGRLGHINASGSSPQRGMILPKEATLEIFRMMADYNAEYLRGLIGDEVDQFSDIELVEQTFNNLFPNFSPWGGWARIVYRFRPNGDNPDECILDAMLLAPWPKDQPKPPAAQLTMLGIDDPWVSNEDLGTLARIFDQDTANITQVHRGLKTKKPPHVIYGAYQESIIRAFHDRYEQRLGLEPGE